MANVEAIFKLEFPLLPKKGRLLRKDWEKAFLVQPMKRIPDVLVPNPGMKGNPPRLHFGWLIDDARLLKLAHKKKIVPRDQRPVTKLENDNGDDEELFDKPAVKMNELWMKRDALALVGKELGLVCEPYLDQVICPGNPSKGTASIVGLIDSYSLKSQAVGREDIPRLAEYFEFKEGPAWFLDSYRWTWNID